MALKFEIKKIIFKTQIDLQIGEETISFPISINDEELIEITDIIQKTQVELSGKEDEEVLEYKNEEDDKRLASIIFKENKDKIFELVGQYYFNNILESLLMEMLARESKKKTSKANRIAKKHMKR